MGGLNPLTLWYRQSARAWSQALPLGNGWMGAMVYGDPALERIALSENTCYSGEPSQSNNQEGAAAYLPDIRAALRGGDYTEAERLAEHIIGKKLNYGTNLPFGELNLSFPGHESCTDYRRSLRLEDALCTVEYQWGGSLYKRTAFVSHPQGVLVLRVECGTPGALSFDVSVKMESGSPAQAEWDGAGLVYPGRAVESDHSDGETGVTLCAGLRVRVNGGRVIRSDDALHIRDADEAVIFLAAQTSFLAEDPRTRAVRRVESAWSHSYAQLLKAHTEDFRSVFGRVELELGGPCDPDTPTDERLGMVKDGAEDPAFMALLFQYGRYLLLCSAREDSPLPAHLQGVWNDNTACRMAWTCDLHLDINTEMNYWPAEVANLPECSAPLFRWIEGRLVPSGRVTARETYGLEGWVAHTVSNVWGYSAPGWAVAWGIFPSCGMWIATHLWEHYLFSGDARFYKDHVLPVYREAALFFVQYLDRDPETGYLLSGPAASPENGFLDERTGDQRHLSMGPTSETVIIRALFEAYLEGCETLGLEEPLLPQVRTALSALPPFRIGREGQLQEWLHDVPEADPHHRHTSHLLSVYPFAQITPEKDPALSRAAWISILRRITPESMWEDTGFARAQLMLYAARLGQAEAAYGHALSFARKLVFENLMGRIPPCAGSVTDIFELDGSTGFTAGVAEMLLQSHEGAIHVLPTLPAAWTRGSVRGLRARGGYEVDFQWENGALTHLAVRSVKGGCPVIRYRDARAAFPIDADGEILLDGRLKPVKNEGENEG